MRETTRNIIERIQRQERHQSVDDNGVFALENDLAQAVSISPRYVDTSAFCIDWCRFLIAQYCAGRGTASRSVPSHRNCTYTT